MPRRSRPLLAVLAVLLISLGGVLHPLSSPNLTQASGTDNVLTEHNDNQRTGAQSGASPLTVANVNQSTFGKLFSRFVDGMIFGQPLYVSGLTMPDGLVHNVVFVGTMHNTVYAFDGDDPAQAQPLWSTTLNGPGSPVALPHDACIGGTGYKDISVEIGIESTPVIDAATGTIYVVAANQTPGTGPGSCGGLMFSHTLYALDITTGTEKLGGHKTIAASWSPSTAAEAVGGVLTFNDYSQNQRAALTLTGGHVWVGFSSYGDNPRWHGWLLGYNAADVTQPPFTWCSTPNGSNGGVWSSGQGAAVDASGNLFVVTGNGAYNIAGTLAASNFGDSIVKLSALGQAQDWFTPYNQQTLRSADLDLGSGGVTIISPTLFVQAGKQGKLYLITQNNLGHEGAGSDSQIQQSFIAANGGHIWNGPVWWSNTLYMWGGSDFLRAYSFDGSLFNLNPVVGSSTLKAHDQGGDLSIGGGILWSNMGLGDSNQWLTPGVLRAFDTSNIPVELYNSQQNAARDAVGTYAKFTPPTVAVKAGKVYLATYSGKLDVYGLFPVSGTPTNTSTATPTALTPTPTTTGTATSTATVTPVPPTNTSTVTATPTSTGVIATGTNTSTPTSTQTATATATVGTQNGSNFQSLFNNVGISDDTAPLGANLDTYTNSFSAEALLAAGVSPGGAITSGGLTYTWPNVPVASPDNVIAKGQTITLNPPVSAATLGFLGAATSGPGSGPITIGYSDSSAQTATLAFSDWTLNGGKAVVTSGDLTAVTTAYRNTKSGKQNHKAYLFSTKIALASGKSVSTVILPSTAGNTQLYLFAVAFGNGVAPPLTATSTPTNTFAVPATATNTSTATSTPTNTQVVPPTLTNTSTNTPTSAPNATSTNTQTDTQTPTVTATATATSTLTPTVTAVATNTSTPSPTLAPGIVALPFNNIGISNAARYLQGNLDNYGNSYSQEALDAAGLTQGTVVTVAGLAFQWPNAAPGTLDNVWVQGQTITLPTPLGGTTLGFLGMSANGPVSGSVTVRYTDGTTAVQTLTISDWTPAGGASGIVSGNTIAAQMSSRYTKDGAQHVATFVVEAGVPLLSGKTVASFTLPAPAYPQQVHIFAATIG